MAKTKPSQRDQRSRRQKSRSTVTNGANNKAPTQSAESLLAEATALLQTSQPEEALAKAKSALALLQPTSEPTVHSLPALNCLGEAYVESGDLNAARETFQLAVSLDADGLIPEEAGGGAAKYMWLAQLCEEGGAESVHWFRKGAEVLRREISMLASAGGGAESNLLVVQGKKRALANALCGMVEVYMTDLSYGKVASNRSLKLTLSRWEDDAEANCEALITEALLVAPESVEALQTLASVRISQLKIEEARAALSRSLELWRHLVPNDPGVPDFATRISLARLLLETEMEEEALEVLERLVEEDDSSVEAWYLGGWCLYIMAQKQEVARVSSTEAVDSDAVATIRSLQTSSRDWLQNCLRLYGLQEYEDERLRDHALELGSELKAIVGESADDNVNTKEDQWEDEDGSDENDSQ